ncbi:MAG TPA: polyprenyl synthetase family protein [Jatrophihabitans sp.]|jgi:geranylgeranyl diphosphate synthase type I
MSAEVVAQVDAALSAFLTESAAWLAQVGPELDDVAHAARRIVLGGGKRLRPLFTYWGWRAARDEPPAALIDAAASLELLHSCALVHDDLMDRSDTRRGHAAAHAAFAELHRDRGWRGESSEFGYAAAIVLGDLLLSWADAMYTRADLGDAARRVFDEMRQLVMAGQYLDMQVQARGEFSVSDALRVIRFKTSKYTVEGPLHLGAAAAGASEETLHALSGYALPIGEAFQLRDDILGVFGDPVMTGKPAGDDLREGKRTLLVAVAMERATPGQAALLREHLGMRTLDRQQVHDVRTVLVESGALDEVEKRIATCTAEARTGLREAAISPAAREALDDLAVAATQRHT